MPVDAAIAPAVFTWNSDAPPTANAAAAFVVPIPTLPFITANTERGAVVPIPTLPCELITRYSPLAGAVDDTFKAGCAAFLTISNVAAFGVVVPIPTLSVVVVR